MLRSKYLYVYLSLAVVGLIGGYVYWYNWGCTEACPIDSSWKISMLRGGIIGLCIAAIFAPSTPNTISNPELKKEDE